MIDPYLMLLLVVSFLITGIVAIIRRHWVEFSVCTFLSLLSLLGLFVGLSA